MPTSRILMTGSRDFNNAEAASDMLQIALLLTGSQSAEATLIHGAARGADLLLKNTAEQLGLHTEAHPAQWNTHSDQCPGWDRANTTCKLAGHRRNAKMIRSGADVCIAFPNHKQKLEPGQSSGNTSRGTWNCAEAAKNAGVPTFVYWEGRIFPFGEKALAMLQEHISAKGKTLGYHHSASILDALLPF